MFLTVTGDFADATKLRILRKILVYLNGYGKMTGESVCSDRGGEVYCCGPEDTGGGVKGKECMCPLATGRARKSIPTPDTSEITLHLHLKTQCSETCLGILISRPGRQQGRLF